MSQERTVQASLFDLFADHEIGRELKAMSQWLDEHRELSRNRLLAGRRNAAAFAGQFPARRLIR
jgi:IS5 family transposase